MKSTAVKEKYAVITGASCGIGEAFAREFAGRGYHLLITGRRKNLLERLAGQLRERHGIRVHPVIVDFANDKQMKRLLLEIDRLDAVEVLVNNAGFGCKKKFFEDSFANQEKMLKVHINATCAITHRMVPKMIANGEGIIINVSSLAAFTPLADNYFYSASKAFLTTFSESLHLALHEKNIIVQALCPGFTITEFHQRPGMTTKGRKKRRLLPWMTAGMVVRKSLRTIRQKNRVIYVPGFMNQLIFGLIKILPRKVYYHIAQNLSAV